MEAITPKLSFRALTNMSRKQLNRLMEFGTAPQLADVVGYEFRGWNVPPLAALIGTRKFKKGFCGQPYKGFLYGYNVRVQQNDKHEPWLARPSEKNPRRFAFFKVFPPRVVGQSRFANTMVIHYASWQRYFFLNPARYTVDYMVYPESSNKDLMLGKSYFELGPIKFFVGHLVLERYNKSEFTIHDSHHELGHA